MSVICLHDRYSPHKFRDLQSLHRAKIRKSAHIIGIGPRCAGCRGGKVHCEALKMCEAPIENALKPVGSAHGSTGVKHVRLFRTWSDVTPRAWLQPGNDLLAQTQLPEIK